jgi:hypothetical protein
MTEFLRDPIWQFIGAVLAIIAIIISIYLYYLQRNKKSLSYDVLLDYRLLSKESGLERRVQILFDGETVRNVSVFAVRIFNDGNIPILATDFVEPLNFSFGTNSKILEAEIAECYPPSLKPAIIINKNGVTLEPLLLNGGDSIILKLLLSKNRDHYESNARIVGVSRLRKGSISNKYFSYAVFGLILALLGGAGLFILSSSSIPPDEQARQNQLFRQQLPLILGIFSIAMIGCTITVFSMRKYLGQFRTYSVISNKFREGKGSSSDW